jgi:quercetin dioxygenase-like cupin family protein
MTGDDAGNALPAPCFPSAAQDARIRATWEDEMTARAVLGVLLLTTFGGIASAQQQPSPVQPSPVTRTILQRADVPGTNLEIIYATVEIAAGVKAGRHSHPGTVIAQVVEGEFWVHFDGQPEKVVRAGESLTVPDRAIHNEGATAQRAKLNAVYVLEKGKPLASPAQ